MSLNINKQGQFLETNFNEYHVEPDGSVWEHIFHHEHMDLNSFSSSDPFASGSVYKSPQMWYNFAACRNLSTFEFMLWQKQYDYSPTYKYRWVQSKNPENAAFADVAAANITKNTSTGYTNWSTGGLYKINSSSTYLCTNNGTNGNWWGAVGKYTVYQGGTPGWAGILVTTGSIDVFVRVDTVDKNAKFYKNGLQVCNNFYEY